MKIAIIGGGPSGIIAAIEIKKRNPYFEVIIFEQKDSLGKKIKASGNGRCNIGNLNYNFSVYKNEKIVENILHDYDQEEYLKSLGILTKTLYDDYLYPVSESANNVLLILMNKLEELGVQIKLNAKLIDYDTKNDTVNLFFSDGAIVVDRVIFATGGKSSPNLGSDGALFPIFEKHGYKIEHLNPGLTPIRVKENVKALFGQRLKALVSLEENEQIIHQEVGEVLFKKDGLSGIVIMNISSQIINKGCKNPKINTYLLNNEGSILSFDDFKIVALDNKNPLLTFVSESISNYVYELANIDKNKFLDEQDIKRLFSFLNPLSFHYLSAYDFDSSQVSLGGISFNNLDKDLSSKYENNVYFIGEVLDVDGPCGGYNLRWAIGSALYLSKNIK
ncbi:MAG: aminoacetone oxidase family FAD-binding enzyme [Erysipelotrichia bacterium]|nr:aminoacetone oxidase family FAD-binding enzyme [Erysipelotrichia bacterium]